jgi:hypothetical protein
MKTKIIIILTIVGSILIGSLFVSIRIIANQNKAIARLEQNQANLLTKEDVNTIVLLTTKELKETMSKELDSTLKANGIKPGQVTDVTNVYNTYNNYDTTVIHPDPVIINKDTIYPVDNTVDCFTIKGYMQILAEKPVLTITERNYADSISMIGYWKRPHKFLFIKWGKKQNFIEASSKCGDVKVQKVDIVKKRE